MVKAVNDVQAAEMLNVHPQTLRNWRHLRKGPPYVKLGDGRSVRYLIEDLEAYLRQGRIVPGDEADQGEAVS